MKKNFFRSASLLVLLLSGTCMIKGAEQPLSPEAQFKTAIQTGDEAAVRSLVEGRLIRVNTKLGCAQVSPLQWAAQHGRVGVAAFLLERQADANYQVPFNKQTALHIAASKKDVPFIELLLRNHANADIPDITGFKPSQLSVVQNVITRLLAE